MRLLPELRHNVAAIAQGADRASGWIALAMCLSVAALALAALALMRAARIR